MATHPKQSKARRGGGQSKVQATGNAPKDLPIVEACAKKAQQQNDIEKGQAIRVCTKKLQEVGRIKEQGDQWIQLPGNRQRG